MLTNKTAYESSSKVCLSWGREKHIMHSTYLHHSSTIALKQATWQRHLLSPSSLTIFSQFQCSLTHKKYYVCKKTSSTHIIIVSSWPMIFKCATNHCTPSRDKWKAVDLCGLGQCFVVVVTVMAFPNVPEIKSFFTNVPNLYIYIILVFTSWASSVPVVSVPNLPNTSKLPSMGPYDRLLVELCGPYKRLKING